MFNCSGEPDVIELEVLLLSDVAVPVLGSGSSSVVDQVSDQPVGPRIFTHLSTLKFGDLIADGI